MATSRLTDSRIKALKPTGKEFALSDGGGLYLIIKPNGNKSWSFRYTHPITSKISKIGLGGYPGTSLQLARESARTQGDLVAQGIDPKQERAKEKERAVLENSNTFRVLAEAWFTWALKKKFWKAKDSISRVRGMLDNHILPWLCDKPMTEITRRDVALLLERVVDQGLLDTPKRVRSIIGRVFDYAIEFHDFPESHNFMRGRNVGGLIAHKTTHHAAIFDKEKIGQLMRDIKGVSGTLLTRTALRIVPYVWQRPGMIRQMHWEHLDLNDALWSIPADQMKMGEDHEVPLPWQVVEALRDLQPLTGSTGQGPVFPNLSRKEEKASPYMSENTVNKALRRLGYCTKKDITAHGFRAMARTILPQELGIPEAWAERHLAHAIDDPNGAAYDRGTYLNQRRKMIKLWADWLDHLADDSAPAPVELTSNVVQLRAARAA